MLEVLGEGSLHEIQEILEDREGRSDSIWELVSLPGNHKREQFGL